MLAHELITKRGADFWMKSQSQCNSSPVLFLNHPNGIKACGLLFGCAHGADAEEGRQPCVAVRTGSEPSLQVPLAQQPGGRISPSRSKDNGNQERELWVRMPKLLTKTKV